MIRVLLLGALTAHVVLSQEAPPGPEESYLGNLAAVIRSIHQEQGFALDYFHRGDCPWHEWRQKGRAEVLRALSFRPASTPLDLRVHRVVPRAGYELRVISFAGSGHYRIPAFLLVPVARKGPFPAIVALHDIGGYYFQGKEKLVATDNEHAALKPFRDRVYGGRSIADELVKRGFVVLVADAFYWGELRLRYRSPPKELAKRLEGLDPASVPYVHTMNEFLRQNVHRLNTSLGFAGTSWLGLVNHDDRRAVDVLVSLPEVDAARIGCVGLSGGGFRSTYLAGLDGRIRAAVIVGWMTSLPAILDMAYLHHAGLFDAVGLHAWLDHPDVAALAAPECAIFVQNCARDHLFTRSGMQAAAEKIQTVYVDLEHPERFRWKFYDVPHQFNVEMQEEAFDWLSQWLKPEPTTRSSKTQTRIQ